MLIPNGHQRVVVLCATKYDTTVWILVHPQQVDNFCPALCYTSGVSTYEEVKSWRNKPKNRRYNPEYMRFKRRYYKTLWKEGKVAYEDVPKAYRYWVKPRD